MKKLGKALSLILTLAMVIMSLPTLASADGEAVQTYYPYSEALSFYWGGASVGMHPWNATNAGTLPGAYGTTEVTTKGNDEHSIKLGMHKNDENVSGTVNIWRISKVDWRKNPTIYISGISETGFMHFKVKLEGLENAKDVKVYFRNSGYQQTKSVSIPNGANITSDGNYHDVYIPLAQMIQSTFDVSKDIIEAHFNCLNTETESYVYVREIDFVAPNAVTVKAARSDKETKLTWEKTTKSIGATPAGYKIFRNGVQIGQTESTVLEYTDTADLDAGIYTYTVVPYTTDGTTETDLNEYSSNGAYVKVVSGFVVNKVYDSASTENAVGIDPWNQGYNPSGVAKTSVSASEVSFIPQGTYAAKLPMGQDVTTAMFNRVEFKFKDGYKDISSYTGLGKLNMSVYIDTAADETATAFDRGLKFQIKSYKKGATSEWLDSTSKTVSSLPLNQWTTISIPLGAFGTAYHKDSVLSVALLNPGKSTLSKADVYVQDINISVDNAILANAQVKDDGVELTWSALSGIFTADGYKILREGVEIADLAGEVASYTDTTKLAVGRYSYTVVPYAGDANLTDYASNKAWADIESEEYKTVYIPTVEYTNNWVDGKYNNYVKTAYYADKNFIPAGTAAGMYPVGTNVSVGIPALDIKVDGGKGDFTKYMSNGILNLWVYIDAPDTELTQYDSNFTIYLQNNGDNSWNSSTSIPLSVPLNKLEKISVPLSKFTGNYTTNNIWSVRLGVGKSSMTNCDVYVQGLNITAPTVYCDKAVIYDAFESEAEEILLGEEYTVKMTLHNGSSSDVTPVYIVAVYDGNGAMKAVYMPETTEAAPAGESKTYSVTLNAPVEDGTYTIKGFMLKSFNTLTPFILN